MYSAIGALLKPATKPKEYKANVVGNHNRILEMKRIFHHMIDKQSETSPIAGQCQAHHSFRRPQRA